MLSHLTAEDLRESADAAVDIAHGLGDSVVVVGFSTGGVAAAWIAQHRADVDRVVIVSPAFALAHIPAWLDRPAMNAALRLPNITRHLTRDTARTDRELGWSTKAVAEVIRLGVAVQYDAERSAPAVRDIRMIINAHDRTVNATPAVALAAVWGAAGVRISLYELPDSLRLPHDLIDPDEPGGHTQLVYPVLNAIIYGEPPSISIARLRTQQ